MRLSILRTPRAACVLVCALSVPAAQAGMMDDAFSKFDRSMATFNPIGTYIRKPIERLSPRLSFKGYVRQSTDILIDPQDTVGFRDQDFRFLQLQNLLELKAGYNVAPGLDVNAVVHGMYDGAYDWQSSRGLYADRIDRTAEVYNTAERTLREFYVAYRTPSFDLLVGKQQVSWGKMDGQFIDIINAMDRREAVQLESEDYEWRRLPTWMVNTTFHFGLNSLQLLYIFGFEEDRQALPGSPWYSPAIPPPGLDIRRPVRHPRDGDFGDHEYGMRFDRAVGALTYGFVYAYLWDRNPTDRVLGTSFVGGQRVLELQGEHERLHHFGATADYATTLPQLPLFGALPAVFRVEALYTKDVRYVDYAKQAAARAGQLNDGTDLHDTLRAAVASEFGLPGNTTLIFQASYYQTIDWRPNQGYGFGGGIGDEWSLILLVFVSRPFAFSRDRLSAALTVFPVLSGPVHDWQGVKTKLRVKYKFSQFITGQLIYTSYDAAAPTDFYGQYNQYDNLGWEISYEF